MKTKTIITDIAHSDLVNLLSTSSFGSSWIGIDADDELYYNEKYRKNGDCIEDVLAKILLDGETILFSDFFAEDELDFNGNLPRHWDKDRCCMVYEVTLKDITEGLQRSLDNGGWDAKCAMDLINEDGDFDIEEAEELMQIIVFGESIYG